jgi:glycosyltransferase involved in cell wall biosynthesis
VKKTLIITEVFYPESFVINDLVLHWKSIGKEIEVLSRVPSYPIGTAYKGYKNHLFQKSVFNKINIYRIPFVPGYQNNLFKKVFNYLNYIIYSFFFLLFNGRKYERIFVYQTGPLINAFSSGFLKFLFNWEIIIWVQDLWPDTFYAYFNKKYKYIFFIVDFISKYIYKNCDKIFVSCEGFIPYIKKYNNTSKFNYFPNWSLVEPTFNNKIQLPGEINFLFAGNIGEMQNLQNVVNAFKNIPIKFPSVFLNIIGGGSYLKQLKNHVKINKINNINFINYVSSTEISDYFFSSDILLISLKNYYLYNIMIPSKFQTYLKFNKPIYSIINGHLSNLILENDLGFSANPSDAKDIEDGFFYLINNIDKINYDIKEKTNLFSNKNFDKNYIINKLTISTFNR